MTVDQIDAQMGVVGVVNMASQSCFFKCWVIVVVVVVYANDCVATRQEPERKGRPNKTSRSCDEDFHSIISEQVAAVDFVCYIIQIFCNAVGNNDVCFLLELSKVINNTGTKKS